LLELEGIAFGRPSNYPHDPDGVIECIQLDSKDGVFNAEGGIGSRNKETSIAIVSLTNEPPHPPIASVCTVVTDPSMSSPAFEYMYCH